LWNIVDICDTINLPNKSIFFSVSNPSRDAVMQKGGTPNEHQQIGHRNARVQGHASHVHVISVSCITMQVGSGFLLCDLKHQPSCPPSSSKVRGFVLVMERARSFTGKAEAGSASRVDPGVVMINPLVGPASCRFRQIQADDVND
jgi:hypothetical protein